MPFQPAAHHLVGTLFLLMLRLGKGEMLARGITMLVGEDDHQIGAGEETGQLFGQTLKGSLVRDVPLRAVTTTNMWSGAICEAIWGISFQWVMSV